VLFGAIQYDSVLTSTTLQYSTSKYFTAQRALVASLQSYELR